MARAVASLMRSLRDAGVSGALPWPTAFDTGGRRALFTFSGDLFVLDLGSSEFTRIALTPEAEKSASFSPDGRYVAFVRSNDLFTYDVERRTEHRVTATAATRP